MTDHMKTQTTITKHDLEHLADEAVRVASETAQDAGAQRIALAVAGVLGGVLAHPSAIAADASWERALADGVLDDLVQALRAALELVDPARQAVA